MDLQTSFSRNCADGLTKVLMFVFLMMTLCSCSKNNTENMGIFYKLFGKKDRNSGTGNEKSAFDTTQLKKTAEMLDEEVFWKLINNSLKYSRNQAEQEAYLIQEIGKLTPVEIVGFRLRTDKLLYDSYTSDMWCAAYIMNGGCSDDGFEYFRNWIISRGRDVYERAMQDPDKLINLVEDDVDVYDFESFWYVALEAFRQKTGKDLYDYIDNENFTTKEGNYPPIEFTWKEEDPESMRRICPLLFEKFNPN